MPAAAVIPAPRVYASGAAAKTLVVGSADCPPAPWVVEFRYWSLAGPAFREPWDYAGEGIVTMKPEESPDATRVCE